MFKRNANTQYNDWIGEVAFDDGDLTGVTYIARQQNAIGQDDVVFAFSAYYSSVGNVISVTVSYSSESYDAIKNDKSSINESSFDITIDDFFSAFKRVSISVAKKGL